MSAPPMPVTQVEDLLVSRFELSHQLAGAMVMSVTDEAEPLAAFRSDSTFATAAAYGLLVDYGSGPDLHVALDSLLRGCPELSNSVQNRRLWVPLLPGELADRMSAQLTQGRLVIEMASSPSGLAVGHAAQAVTDIGLDPLYLPLDGISPAQWPEFVRDVYVHARLLSQAPLFDFPPEVEMTREWLQPLLDQNWPTVVLVEKHSRRFVPAIPVATFSGPADASPQLRVAAWRQVWPEVPDEVVEKLTALPLSWPQMLEATRRAQLDPGGSATALHRHATETILQHASGLATPRYPDSRAGELCHPPAVQAQLDELARAAKALHGRANSRRGGLRAILSGPSGTGKTASAIAMAADLGVPALFVDTARIVDKFIGETEKHLDRLFEEACSANAVLVFDEGETLFSKRSASTSDSGSDAMNRQIGYLLTRLESHDGIVLLSSNFPGAIDKAFLRRFHLSIAFTLPDREARTAIWREKLASHGLADLHVEASKFAAYELAGGSIESICYLGSLIVTDVASDTGDTIQRLIDREMARLGKLPRKDV